DIMVLTDHPAAPLATDPVHYSGRLPSNGVSVSPGTAITITQMAARVEYTPPNPAQNYTNITFAQHATGDTITRTSGDWTLAGFAAGPTIFTSGAGNNNGQFVIDSVTPLVITLKVKNSVTAETDNKAIQDLDTGNWFQQVKIPVIGDPWFDIQPGHENFRS